MFIFERESVCVCVRAGEGQREKENLKQALGSELSAQNLTWGKLTD